MSKSASAGTFGWTINGLIRSASAAIEAQSETRKGLPAFIKVVGANKLWTAEISGDVTDATIVSLEHDDKVACSILADGITVLGFLTSFSCSGSSNSVVEFRAACEGKSTGTGTAADPGDPVFLEEGTITGGDVTDATGVSLAHDDKVACSILADGIKVLGYLTSFSCSGSSNSVVEFRAACEGKSTGSGSAADPGDPVFLEEGTITGADATASADIIEFSIDCSWTLEHTFDETGEPTADGTSFKSFDGSATFVTSELGSDETGASEDAVGFSIAVGGLTVAGTGKTTKVEQTAEVDGLIKFKRTVTIVTIT